MDIKRIEYFLRIAELGSLNRATEYLRISQPSLSRQMRLLEEELGVQLFRRHRRGMQLTPEGEELRDRLAIPIRQVRLALQDMKSLSSKAGGTVTIGMMANTAYMFAGRLAQRVRRLNPNITLKVVEEYAGSFVKSLEAGKLDIALIPGPSSHWQFSTEPVLVEDLMLVGAADCSLSPDNPIEFNNLANYPLILPSPAHYPDVIRIFAEKLHGTSGNKFDVRMNADSTSITLGYVKMGLGYALLTPSTIYREAKDKNLRYSPIVNPNMPLELLLAVGPACQYPRATSYVKSIIFEEITDMVTKGAWPQARLPDAG